MSGPWRLWPVLVVMAIVTIGLLLLKQALVGFFSPA
jgi:hypothetical protein